MTMDNGEGRPLDELESGHEDPQGWYFDLPSDAWKRQEEKSRLLRERVRKNEAEPAEPERRDPFVLRRPEPEPPKKRGLFGFGRKKRGDEDEHPAGRREEPTAGRPGWLTADDGDADEWSTERVEFGPAQEEPALRLRPRPRGEEPVDRAVGGPEVPPTPAPVEPPPLRLRSRTEPEQGSRLNWDFGPGAWPETPAKGGAEPPVDSPEDEESIFARMQAWAERGREEQHRRLGLGHPQDVQAEECSAPHGDDAAASAASQWPGAAAGAGGLDDREAGEPAHGPELPPLRLRREPADAQREERKSSRWDEFFGLNREEGEEDGPGFSEGLAAMREWAKKKPLGDDIREIPEEFLKPFDWELEEQGQAGGDARQEDPFAAFRVSGEPGPGADREAKAPAWLDSATGGDAQQDDPFAAFRVSGEPGPAADRQAGAAGDDDPLAGVFAPRDVTEASETPKEKRGLFGRLFGRKRQDGPGDEPAAPLAADWLFEPAEATPAEPLRAADAPGAWIRADADNGAPEEAWGASAGPTFAQDRTVAEGFAAEVRAEDAPVTAGTSGSTRAEGRLPVEDESVSFDRAEEPAEDEEWAPEPVPLFQAPPEPGPGAGPAAVIEPQAAPDDEEEWAPEPVPPFAAPQAAAGEVPAGEAAGETSSAQDGAAWEPESAELSPSAFGAAVQAAFWSAPAVDDAPAAERPWWETPEAEETTEDVVGSEPVAVQPEAAAEERPWWETPEAEETTESVVGSEPVAVQPEATAAERPWWEAQETEETTENVVGSEPVAVQPEATAAERPWWEAPEAEETTESVVGSEPVAVQPEATAAERPWWETPEAEETAGSVAGSEPVAVQPEATAAERPWRETQEAEETTETVVGSEPVAVQPEATAAERPWWETQETEETTENVVGSEPVAVQPEAMAAERPWWEAPEAEETTENVVGSEPVAVQPEATAAERPWWEAPEAEESVEETVAGAEPAVESQPGAPAAAERPWWEAPEAEETVEEAVASAEPAVESQPGAPAAAERPWWEAPEAEETAEAAAGSEPVAVQPEATAAERPWWETPEAEETTESVVGSEPVAVQPEATAAERPWWETPEAEETAEAAAGSEPVAVQPEATAAERPWWEAPEAEETTESVVGSEPVAVQPEATAAERPWWERPAGFEPSDGWTQAQPAAAQREDRDSGSDDMWGDIAETAELAAAGPGDSGELDLAASLEAQLGASLDEPAWTAPSPPAHEGDAFRSTEDEGDVILKAFEAHASTPDLDEGPAEVAALEAETAAALSALFGDNATEIVAEAGEEPPERPFIRLGAWAPQRTLPADDGWVPEEEVRQELDARTNPLGFMVDPLAATPPWLSEAETGEDERPERAGSDGKLKAWVREVVETVMLAALVFLSVRASFGNFKVDGNSMYPTLENGEFLIVNKLVYSEVDLEKLSNFLPFIDPGSDPTRYVFHGPERGDIIVLRDPRDPNTDLIKRVIGLPGETIEIVNGKVYINDRLLEEPYITTPWNDTLPKILIPPDEYFVMGDNRNNSLDSRSAQVGLVSKDLIIGKAVLTYLPLNRFGLAPNGKGVLTEQKPVLTTKRIGEE
jgi:signal peptidase I